MINISISLYIWSLLNCPPCNVKLFYLILLFLFPIVLFSILTFLLYLPLFSLLFLLIENIVFSPKIDSVSRHHCVLSCLHHFSSLLLRCHCSWRYHCGHWPRTKYILLHYQNSIRFVTFRPADFIGNTRYLLLTIFN